MCVCVSFHFISLDFRFLVINSKLTFLSVAAFHRLRDICICSERTMKQLYNNKLGKGIVWVYSAWPVRINFTFVNDTKQRAFDSSWHWFLPLCALAVLFNFFLALIQNFISNFVVCYLSVCYYYYVCRRMWLCVCMFLSALHTCSCRTLSKACICKIHYCSAILFDLLILQNITINAVLFHSFPFWTTPKRSGSEKERHCFTMSDTYPKIDFTSLWKCSSSDLFYKFVSFHSSFEINFNR